MGSGLNLYLGSLLHITANISQLLSLMSFKTSTLLHHVLCLSPILVEAAPVDDYLNFHFGLSCCSKFYHSKMT